MARAARVEAFAPDGNCYYPRNESCRASPLLDENGRTYRKELQPAPVGIDERDAASVARVSVSASCATPTVLSQLANAAMTPEL